MRGERRFLEHPFTPQTLELFRLWAQVRPELAEMAEEWGEAITSPAVPPDQEKKKRPRRRSRRPRRSQRSGHAQPHEPGQQ
jgi:poly(A) polymerase